MEQTKTESNVEMTWSGIGPKLAFITLPYIILSLIITKRDPEFLRLNFLNAFYAQLVGYILLGAGIIFWLFSAVIFLSDFNEGNLIVRGPFAVCRNPIYTSFILFILPALALIFQSGIILTIDLVLYLNFKLSIHGEQLLLQRKFGDAYALYENSVNELLPFPKFKKKLQ